ncbi:unnamed protein product [Didymodactylos carnosus]|uniref:Protein Wnt n=1 Tax=Didymodactylos carnosus TaxID=1234261 RepID=A0A814C9F7_9BILA|nr:unnamed protein product [Didymodactylos carnosus]CAF0939490.1 unnamed protein product [Didymodactylos carnosus]CAF3554991.1 unnamed protein product [Didymodactylos carnosus]CAF3716186.1 unnamed protein product [Didymodactylos carnosus]
MKSIRSIICYLTFVQYAHLITPLWWNIGLQQQQKSPIILNPYLNSDEQQEQQLQTDEFLDDPSQYCSAWTGLSIGQKQICLLHADHMPIISQGTAKGIQECQFQFQDRHWNCSILHDGTVFGRVLKQANRETAFANAIFSASVTYAVSRACKQGLLKSCTCSRKSRPKSLPRDWSWGGCGDNIDYGYRFSRDFVDTPENEIKLDTPSVSPILLDAMNNVELPNEYSIINPVNDHLLLSKRREMKRRRIRRQMNLHNNEAGRRAVYRLTRVVCKCHGVSGSCSLRTCYQQLPTFREIATFLKEKYDSAVEVRFSGNTSNKNRQQPQIRTRDRRFAGPTKDDLIYVHESNFCDYNPRVGSFGTKDRLCNKTSYGSDSCKSMCCGRGYNTIRKYVQEKCNCKFVWCCSVQCLTCTKLIEIQVCK